MIRPRYRGRMLLRDVPGDCYAITLQWYDTPAEIGAMLLFAINYDRDRKRLPLLGQHELDLSCLNGISRTDAQQSLFFWLVFSIED